MTTDNSRALVKQEVQPPQMLSLPDVMEYSKIMVQSGMFRDVKSISQACVKILAGQELGIPPYAAMRGFTMIEGKPPEPNAGLTSALIKRHPKYDYETIRSDDDACVLRFVEIFRDGSRKDLGASSFTREDAQRAKLLLKDVWQKYPKAMFFARALTQGARQYCADVFNGTVYTAEELGADDAPALSPAAAVSAAVTKAQPPPEEPGLLVDTQTGEVVTEAQRDQIAEAQLEESTDAVPPAPVPVAPEPEQQQPEKKSRARRTPFKPAPPAIDEIAERAAENAAAPPRERDYSAVQTPAQMMRNLRVLGWQGTLHDYTIARGLPFVITPSGELDADSALDIGEQIDYDMKVKTTADAQPQPLQQEGGDPNLLGQLKASVQQQQQPSRLEGPMSDTTRSRIMIMCRERDISDAERYGMTMAWIGKKSTKDFSEADGRYVCQKLELIPPKAKA